MEDEYMKNIKVMIAALILLFLITSCTWFSHKPVFVINSTENIITNLYLSTSNDYSIEELNEQLNDSTENVFGDFLEGKDPLLPGDIMLMSIFSEEEIENMSTQLDYVVFFYEDLNGVKTKVVDTFYSFSSYDLFTEIIELED